MNEKGKNPIFYFWNNGEIYRHDRPVFRIAKVPPLSSVCPEGAIPPFPSIKTLTLQTVAMSYFDSDARQRVFVLNIPNQWPEIRFSLNFPFDRHFERVLIGAMVDTRRKS